MAKGICATIIPSVTSSATGILNGGYQNLPSFVTNLNSLLSAIHTMVIFSPKDEINVANADMQAQLEQSISTINTAQKELAEKLSLLDKAMEVAGRIESNEEKSKEILNACIANEALIKRLV